MNDRTHVGLVYLAEIDTSEDTYRFMLGADGIFIDSLNREWVGSQVLGVPNIGSVIGGAAPSGQISLPFFQDPNAPDLVSEVKALGRDSINGREIRFYYQRFSSLSEMYAPTTAPVLFRTRIMRQISATAPGAQDRVLTLSFESWTENRSTSRRIALNTEGHAKLLGQPNPSLSFMPTYNFQEEKLFG